MSELIIEDLEATAGGTEILRGLSLKVRSGEVHAVMGPNGSGKSTLSHVVMGRPGYEVTGGSVTLDGADVLAMSPFERAQAGLFLAMQYPTEVPGVVLRDVLGASFTAAGRDPEEIDGRVAAEAPAVGMTTALLERSLNMDLSGGEKKRNETLQLAVLEPKIALLDELDSGLDVDALQAVSRRIEEATKTGLGVLAITHYTRLFRELKPDRVHILVRGRIVESGGPELADRLESSGYDEWTAAPTETTVGIGSSSLGSRAKPADADPFADPLA